MGNSSLRGTEDGSSSATDGGIDNIGAAGGFLPGKPDSNAPVPDWKAAERKKNKAFVKADDDFAPMQ